MAMSMPTGGVRLEKMLRPFIQKKYRPGPGDPTGIQRNGMMGKLQ